MQAKRSEMVYLLNCYYPIKELAAFYAPVYRYSHSFQYFVMQNYQKAKDVETIVITMGCWRSFSTMEMPLLKRLSHMFCGRSKR